MQAALEIKRLIIQHGINNAKFAEVLMKKIRNKRQIKKKLCKEFSGNEDKVHYFDE